MMPTFVGPAGVAVAAGAAAAVPVWANAVTDKSTVGSTKRVKVRFMGCILDSLENPSGNSELLSAIASPLMEARKKLSGMRNDTSDYRCGWKHRQTATWDEWRIFAGLG